MLPIFKVFIEFVILSLLFYVLGSFFLAPRHVGSLLPDHGLDHHPLHWGSKVLTRDCQGNPQGFLFDLK